MAQHHQQHPSPPEATPGRLDSENLTPDGQPGPAGNLTTREIWQQNLNHSLKLNHWRGEFHIDLEGSGSWLPTERLAPSHTLCDFFLNYIDSSKGGGGGTYIHKCSQVDEMIEMC